MSYELPAFVVQNPLLFFGVLSGCLSVVAYVPYIVDIIREKTRPDRACWLIWAVLSSISFVSQVSEGATMSLMFAGVQSAGTILISVLSIWRGHGRFLGRRNLMLFAVASVGLVLWYATDVAVYALLISIGISLMGGAVTVVKAYKEPDSETLSTWTIAWSASICAIFSVGAVDLVVLAYPLYLLTLYSGIIAATLMAPQSQARELTAVSP